MFAVPSKALPAIVLLFAKAVAVSALPVILPVILPTNPVLAVIVVPVTAAKVDTPVTFK